MQLRFRLVLVHFRMNCPLPRGDTTGIDGRCLLASCRLSFRLLRPESPPILYLTGEFPCPRHPLPACSPLPPPLVELRTFPEWLRWVESRRDAVPYDYAALAVDRLAARHGVAALVDYFTRFARSHDGDRVFEDVFGQSIAQFDR